MDEKTFQPNDTGRQHLQLTLYFTISSATIASTLLLQFPEHSATILLSDTHSSPSKSLIFWTKFAVPQFAQTGADRERMHMITNKAAEVEWSLLIWILADIVSLALSKYSEMRLVLLLFC